MGNNRNIITSQKASAAYAHVKPQSGNVNPNKGATVKSNLVFRSAAELDKSRCAAYSYLIP